MVWPPYSLVVGGPPPSLIKLLLTFASTRRLLISQDRGEIFLTFASFDKPYVAYIQGRSTPQHGEPESFLRMHEFGPFNTSVADHMRELGYITLAFALQASHQPLD